MLFLDTSALVKLLVPEAETPALRRRLSETSELVACGLVRTELRRAAARRAAALVPSVDALLARLDLVPVDDALLDTAGTLGPATLRSLDAVHLAAAVRVAPVQAVVSYDERMVEAAVALGLPVEAPA